MQLAAIPDPLNQRLQVATINLWVLQPALALGCCCNPRSHWLQVAAINTAMGSLVKTCTTFPNERTIVTRERSKNSYNVLPYFVSKLIAELPVGALFPILFGFITYPTTGLNPKKSR